MAGNRIAICLLVSSLLFSACSVALTQEAPIPSPISDGPSQQSAQANPALPAFQVPVTWDSLHLTGKLLYTSSQLDGNSPLMRIQLVDLATGRGETLYQAPANGMIDFASVSPDGKELVMAFSAPPGPDLSAHQELYIMPLDASAPPQLLLTPATADDEYFQPEWSPDGKYIYFSRVNFHAAPVMPKQHYPIYQVFRMAYPDGQPEKLAEQAYWPRLSADSTHLVYVSLDPLDGKTKLFLANPDGSNAQQIMISGQGAPDIIDAPIFSPDGQSILFSAVTPSQASAPSWLDKLLGMTVASAHVLPSDWWSVPLKGGQPTQLTHIMAVGLFGSISPDKQYIASYSGGGIFVMRPDGTESTMLINDVGGLPGTVSWIP